MRTNFVRNHDTSDGDGGFKFFSWAILVVAAGLLMAATGEYAPKQDSQAALAHAPAATTVVETTTPAKT